jgi:hypothetical protein
MKRSTILATTIALACLSLNTNAQNKNVKQASNTNSNQPYKVEAANVTIGNNAYADKVLWLWKYFDDNTLEKAEDMIADDVIATFPDGTVVKGKEDFMKSAKAYRSSLASCSSTVSACVPLKSPDDPDRQVVSIWGASTETTKDGKVTKTHLNEVWFFNKQGKVVEFHQMAAKDSPEDKT